jgi:hypothetical protein
VYYDLRPMLWEFDGSSSAHPSRFRDAHERDTWREHRDDLTLGAILDHLIDDLRSRDRVSGNVARDGALGQLLIDEYVKFPISTASSASSTG